MEQKLIYDSVLFSGNSPQKQLGSAIINSTIKQLTFNVRTLDALTPLRQPYLLVLFNNVTTYSRDLFEGIKTNSKTRPQALNIHKTNHFKPFPAQKGNTGFTVWFLNTKRSQAINSTLPQIWFPISSSCFYLKKKKKNECTVSSFLLTFLPWPKKWKVSASPLVTSLLSGPSEDTCVSLSCSPTCASSTPWTFWA